MSVAEKFEVIADAVYEKGVADQKAVSVDWDNIQQNGTRKYWDKAFAYWGEGEVNPKYMIKPTAIASTGAQSMFQGSYVKKVDWTKFDFSECITLYTAFNSCPYLEEIGVYDENGNPQGNFALSPTSTAVNMWNYMFSGGQELKRIQKIVTKLNQTYTSTFYKCNKLEEIRFAPYDADAGIGIGEDISFADSPKLTRESMESILLALAPVDGKTLAFSSSGNSSMENKMKEYFIGNGIQLTAETQTVDEITFTNDGSGFFLSGRANDNVVINLLNPQVAVSNAKYGASFMLQDLNGTLTNYLQARVKQKNGEEVLWDGKSWTRLLQTGNTVMSIDLVIPKGTVFSSTIYCKPIGYLDYLEPITNNHSPISNWTIIY